MVEAELLDAHVDHRRAADEDRAGQVSSTTARTARSTRSPRLPRRARALSSGMLLAKHRLHDDAGLVHERWALDGRRPDDRPRGDAGVDGRLGHRRRDLDDQARVEGLRDQVVRGRSAGRRRGRRWATTSDVSASPARRWRTQASFISSVILVAATSRAPRKMKGKHSTLLTWFG